MRRFSAINNGRGDVRRQPGKTEEAYRALIDFLAQKTIGSLLVSGYAADLDSIQKNPMLFFYEPLQTSLRRTGRFRAIRRIGAHSRVTVYRCDV